MLLNRIGREITNTDYKVFIMRGVSGVGKSTLARELAKKHNATILSADIEIELFDISKTYSENYNFMKKHDMVFVAHKRMMDKYTDLLGSCNIIIDNTNTLVSDVKYYYLTALDNGYSCEQVELVDLGTGGFTVEELYERNIHGVPMEHLSQMYQNITNNPIIKLSELEFKESVYDRRSDRTRILDSIKKDNFDNVIKNYPKYRRDEIIELYNSINAELDVILSEFKSEYEPISKLSFEESISYMKDSKYSKVLFPYKKVKFNDNELRKRLVTFLK